MKYCIISWVRKHADINKIRQFIQVLSETTGEFFVCIVNNSSEDVGSIIEEFGIDNYEVISNKQDVSISTCINQGLTYASISFDYSVCVNFEHAMIIDRRWIESLDRYTGDRFIIGGTLYDFKIRPDNDSYKMIDLASKNGNLEWMADCVDGKKNLKYIDKNIMLLDNKKLHEVGCLNTIDCNDDNSMIEFSFRICASGYGLTSIREIYSNPKDIYRFDVMNKVKEGVEIFSPIITNAVRNKFA
jgi:hypothetical protein